MGTLAKTTDKADAKNTPVGTLRTAVSVLIQSLESAHEEAFPGCDGTCSYHDALRLGRRALRATKAASADVDKASVCR